MKYKLIASDLDGTLNNDNYIVSEGNIQAIKKATEAGLKVILCSGRGPVSLGMYEKEIGLNTKGSYGIGFNGATVYEADTNKVIFNVGMDKELAINIIREVKQISKDVPIAVFVKDDYVLAETKLAVFEEIKEDTAMTLETVQNLESAIIDDIIKIILVDEREHLDDIYIKVKDLNNDKYNIVFTGKNLLEFLPISINKAQGISKLAKHLGISLDEVVAIGDNYNDIEMVSEVGLGIAVANAVQPLKDVADYITKRDNNNDALIEVVDMVLKINSES